MRLFRSPALPGMLGLSVWNAGEAISEPDAEVPSEYWTITIKTAKGQTLNGTRLNEDTHSIQLRDEGGRLISVMKSNISNSEMSRKSRMPAFTGKFTEQQMDNLIAYLTRLREEK